MKKIITTIAVLLILFTGCTYKQGETQINKDFYKTASDVKYEKYTEIGPVSTTVHGWLLSDCNAMGKKSIQALENKAKHFGADAVVNVGWQGEEGKYYPQPQCLTEWGWGVFWIMWMVPYTSHTTASGIMIKYDK